MYYYAQINAERTVIGISELSGESNQPDMIPLEEYNTNKLGWRFIDNEWLEPMPIPPQEQHLIPPTENELKLMEATVELYEQNLGLQEEVEKLKTQNTNTMLAVTEVYEMILGGIV